MNTYIRVLEQFSNFQGRARREEYWMFSLFNFIFAIVALITDHLLGIVNRETGIGPIYLIYTLIIFIPGLAVSVRRLHDTGNSGWMLFISLIPIIGSIWLLVLLVTEGDKKTNKYGADPKNTNNHSDLHSFSMIEEENKTDLTRDNIILIIIVWMLISKAFWRIIPSLFTDFFNSNIYIIINLISSLIWGIIPFALAFIVKDKSKQMLLYIISGILMLITIYGMFDRDLFSIFKF